MDTAMMWNQLLAIALDEGCGEKLDDVLCSDEFHDRLKALRAKYDAIARSATDEAVALRAGHIESGQCFNTATEDVALNRLDQGDIPPAGRRTILQMLGEKLVAAAGDQLDESLEGMALQWPRASAEEQLLLLGCAFHYIVGLKTGRSEDHKVFRNGRTPDPGEVAVLEVGVAGSMMQLMQQDFGELRVICQSDEDKMRLVALNHVQAWAQSGMPPDDIVSRAIEVVVDMLEEELEDEETSIRDWLYLITDHTYRYNEVLPNAYSIYDPERQPNCLGMAIILVSLARRCGAKVMLVSQMSLATRKMWELSKDMSGRVCDLLSNINSAQVEWMQTLGKARDKAAANTGRVQDFHYSAVIQIADGRWVVLDPYQSHWGVWPDTATLDEHYRLLIKYAEVLPGLTLMADFVDQLADQAKAALVEIDAQGEQALRLSQLLDEFPVEPERISAYDDNNGIWYYPFELACVMWMADVLNDDLDSDELYDRFVERAGAQVDEQREGKWERFLGAMLGYFPKSVEEFKRLNIYADMFYDDDDYRRRRTSYFVTMGLDMAMREVDLLVAAFGNGLDPIMEVSLPEYNLALAVLNHIRCWAKVGLPGKEFLPYSSSQTYWHEAVDLSQGLPNSAADDHEVRRAEDMVRALPYVHPACECKLGYLDRLRAEGGASNVIRPEPVTAGGQDPGAARGRNVCQGHPVRTSRSE